MEIKIETDNCDFKNYYHINECADSEIKVTLSFPKIVSRQSKKESINKLTELIQNELSKFEWIIVGSILVDLTWYLNAVERQETDKIGDIDNITKPIIDSLGGLSGLFVDDSQIGGLYSCWFSRNHNLAANVLVISIKFNNDYVLKKENLKFIQYSDATCIPLNIDLDNTRDLLLAKILINARIKLRNNANKIGKFGGEVDRYFICSEYEFHRTRLSGFPSSSILQLSDINSIFSKKITFAELRKLFILKNSKNDKNYEN